MVVRLARTHKSLCLLVAVLLMAPASRAYANMLPYVARFAAQESLLSEMTTHPTAVSRKGVTYLAYQGVGFDPYVTAHDEATGAWDGPFKIGTNPLRLDAHGAPAFFFDSAGYAHAFFGGHGGQIQHRRATAPDSVATWTTQTSPGTGTYPQVLDQDGRAVLLFYRRTNADWVYRQSSDDAATFGPDVPVLAAEAGAQWYASAYLGAGGRIHLVFTWVDMDLVVGTAFLVRRNVYYASREPTGEWRAADGSALAMPISLAKADAHCRIVDSGSSFANELTVRETERGDPVVLFLMGRGAGDGAYAWRSIRRREGVWRASVTLTTTDHYFDAAAFQRTGPTTFEAFLVTKDSDAEGSADGNYRGRGGRIERWESSDDGASWAFVERVSPAEPGIIYSSPVIVRAPGGAARLAFTDWTDDESDFFHRLFLWGDAGLVTRETQPSIARIAGPHRSATAIAVSQRGFPEGARFVVVATERDFPDAIAGTPLATTVNGPLLLTPPGYLPDSVATEIRRLGATHAIVLGGTGAVTDAVLAQLTSKAGCTRVERVGGATRFDTALAIARRMRDRTRAIRTALVVNGRTWPDAIAAAPLAGANDWPIVLTDGDTLPAQSRAILTEYGITNTLIVGQEDVVGPAVERALPSPVRVGGDDRYATAALLAEYSLGHGLLHGRVIAATGANFPDALAAGVLGARARAPLLLVRAGDPTEPTRSYLHAHATAVSDLWVIGGVAVVSDGVQALMGSIVTGDDQLTSLLE